MSADNMKRLIFAAVTTFLVAGNISAQSSNIPFSPEAGEAAITPTTADISAVTHASRRAMYTLGMAMPVGSVTYGLLAGDNKMLKTGIEVACSRMMSVLVTEGCNRLADRNKTGISYADYVYKYPSYSETAAEQQSSLAFATATSIALEHRKWYVVVPAYMYAGTVAATSICYNNQKPGNVLVSMAIGTATGLATHWLTNKLFPTNDKMAITDF